jgi:hypothetical protein
MVINITDKLYKEIDRYCKLNNLETEKHIGELLRKAFTVEKYGERPPFDIPEPKEKKKVEILAKIEPVTLDRVYDVKEEEAKPVAEIIQPELETTPKKINTNETEPQETVKSNKRKLTKKKVQ